MNARPLSYLPRVPLHYGGESVRGRRKRARPFDPRRPVHLVLRSSAARGAHSLLHPHHRKQVDGAVRRLARKWRVRIHRYRNAGHGLQLLVQADEKRRFQAFLRELAGRVAMLVTGAAKGRGRKFWDHLAWSRVVDWGRDFKRTVLAVLRNLLSPDESLPAMPDPDAPPGSLFARNRKLQP